VSTPPEFSALALGTFMRREAAMMTKVLSSSPISRGGPAKGNCSADGGLVRASESRSGDPTRDLSAPRWPSVRIPSAPPRSPRRLGLPSTGGWEDVQWRPRPPIHSAVAALITSALPALGATAQQDMSANTQKNAPNIVSRTTKARRMSDTATANPHSPRLQHMSPNSLDGSPRRDRERVIQLGRAAIGSSVRAHGSALLGRMYLRRRSRPS
jgi:hypothetical protein